MTYNETPVRSSYALHAYVCTYFSPGFEHEVMYELCMCMNFSPGFQTLATKAASMPEATTRREPEILRESSLRHDSTRIEFVSRMGLSGTVSVPDGQRAS